jgi:S-adenosylmethionine synthetase
MRRNGRCVFTSESVTEGHPDKIADQIADAVLDAVMAADPASRVACETLVTTGLCLIAGEITTRGVVDYQKLARATIRDIGYTDAEFGFDYKTCSVLTCIDGQSPDIALGVDRGGAGDQGLMFGYACRETEELMPLPIVLAHRLVRRLTDCRKQSVLGFLRPDGKSQVTVEYREGRPVRVDAVVLSTQHSPQAAPAEIEEGLRECVIRHVIPPEYVDQDTKVFINPTGRFITGGPQGDAGLTGRKIIVDTYGGLAHHGGGAFSGKDPSKVDRSAAYMARYVAKNLVAAGLADELEVQLAYAIGVEDPVSIFVHSFGTGKLSDERLVALVREHFPLTPRGIIEHLDLRRPIYGPTAAYGHFGRSEPSFTWESTKVAQTLLREVRA